MQNVYEHIFEFRGVQHLVYMASIGYGYTKMSIQRMAKEYAISFNTNNCKNENSEHLSNNWFYGFLKRCRDLHSLRIFLFPVQKVQLLKIVLLISTNYPQFSPAMVYPNQTKSTTLMTREFQLTIRHQRSSVERHRSHISLTLTDWAKRNNIIIFVLAPQSIHVNQPLDIGVFGPLKRIYNRV